jgi:hypothetical protein
VILVATPEDGVPRVDLEEALKLGRRDSKLLLPIACQIASAPNTGRAGFWSPARGYRRDS